jgi:aryl-alcohol dehydrogenase-like predicted oxidoreductase/spore coat polysaccharide biosynthesis protein SpsF (cytidylyltransferase family)
MPHSSSWPRLAVLQCRTSSHRLPAKAHLPVAGIPSVLLAALRASNTGRRVVVATSREHEDDLLATTVQAAGLTCVRGDLHDVLSRFLLALEANHDDQPFFRLSADNVFPDGAFLDEMEEFFLSQDLRYLSSTGPDTGLPYGLSAEITTVGQLRDLARKPLNPSDREHVTSALARMEHRSFFNKHAHLAKQQLRCTLDNLEDYLVICKVFEGIREPVATPWRLLVEKLASLDRAPSQRRSRINRLVIGTAQWGSKYGITNESRPPSLVECRAMLEFAHFNGIRALDTARAYGESERLIGMALREQSWRMAVHTKLAPFDALSCGSGLSSAQNMVECSVLRSCRALQTDSLDTLLLHRASELQTLRGAVWETILSLQREGLIKRVGVSVQSPEELRLALQAEKVEHIQMPFNVLDWRWDHLIRLIVAEKSKRSLTIHVRSIFLQGLLLSKNELLWKAAHVTDPSSLINWLATFASSIKAKSLAEASLRYVASHNWIDGVVVGIDNMSQLQKNVHSLDNSEWRPEFNSFIESSRPMVTNATLNPALWRRS